MTVVSVRLEQQGPVVVAFLRGEIDLVSASQVDHELFDAAPNDAPGLIVDLSGVTYLDSRGLYLLFALAERLRVRNQRLHVVVPDGAPIRRVMLLTHLDSVAPLFPSVSDAVAQMTRAS